MLPLLEPGEFVIIRRFHGYVVARVLARTKSGQVHKYQEALESEVWQVTRGMEVFPLEAQPDVIWFYWLNFSLDKLLFNSKEEVLAFLARIEKKLKKEGKLS